MRKIEIVPMKVWNMFLETPDGWTLYLMGPGRIIDIVAIYL